jgi:hypothetical protein
MLLPGKVDIFGGYAWVIGDVEISHDQALAFVSAYYDGIYVIDLNSMTLASGVNPIYPYPPLRRIQDLSISADGKFLLACDSSSRYPVVSLDVDTGAVVDSFYLNYACNAVEACDDGSVLVTDYSRRQIRRLSIDGNGMFHDTGDLLELLYYRDYVSNVYGAPGSRSGVVLHRYYYNENAELGSFTIPGLTQIDNVRLSGRYGIGACFSPDGAAVYARTAYYNYYTGSYASLHGYSFDPASGQIGAQLFPPVSIRDSILYTGMDMLAVTAQKIYVPTYGRVEVHDALTGAYLYPIVTTGGTTSGDLATGIKIPGEAGPLTIDVDIAPNNRNNPINIDNNGWGQVVIALISSRGFDATAVDLDSVMVENAPIDERGGSGKRKSYANHDVNHDGVLDLLIHVRRKLVGADRTRDIWTVTGLTASGREFSGSDSVTYVPYQK